MSDDERFERLIETWLADGRNAASGWVSSSVIAHARSNPRGAPIRVRWSDAMKAVVAAHPRPAASRWAIVLFSALLVVALAGIGYMGARGLLLAPAPTSTPSPSPTAPLSSSTPSPEQSSQPPATPPPSPRASFASSVPTAIAVGPYACPPGADPNMPGPSDQARPARDMMWRAAVDAQSGAIVIASREEIWTFDLCTNTWQRMSSTVPNGVTQMVDPTNGRSIRVNLQMPVYVPEADLTVMIGPERVMTYDADADVVTDVGATPIAGQWTAAYDSRQRVIIARENDSARMWTYDIQGGDWTEIVEPGNNPGACGFQDPLMTYDAAVDRVVLLRDCAGPDGLNTFEFDLSSATWQRIKTAAPNLSPIFDWNGPYMQMAYDEANQLSVTYGAGILATYDASQDAWQSQTLVGRGAHIFNHMRVPVVYDPGNRRVIFVAGDPLGLTALAYTRAQDLSDVTSLDLATGNWVTLLATPEPPAASPSP